jgi:phage terminase large subunit-like protein
MSLSTLEIPVTDPKWIRNKSDELAIKNGCWFDPAPAERACKFFRTCLQHTKGEWRGQPIELLDWQRFEVLYPLLGWMRYDSLGRIVRRFTRGLVFVPKKSGKSTIGAGLAIYLTVADGEPGAEVYTAAKNAKQARIVWGEAAEMVRRSPALNTYCRVNQTTGRITVPSTFSWLQSLHGDAGSLDGLNVSGLIFDELHQQKNSKLFDMLSDGTAARRQPLVVAITTAGDEDDKHSICREQYEHGLKVNAGEIEDQNFFAYIRQADKEDDWTDEKTWYKANPSLGHTITIDSFRADFNKAKLSLAGEIKFRRKRLNQWVSDTDAKLIPVDAWNACKGRVAKQTLMASELYIGVDLSSYHDLTAVVYLWKLPTGKLYLQPHFWTTQDEIDKRGKTDATPFTLWAKQGWIKVCKGRVIRQGPIKKAILKATETYENFVEAGFDYHLAPELVESLADEGVATFTVPQTNRHMNAPLKKLEELVFEKELIHDGNPVMAFCIENLVVSENEDGMMKPNKKKAKDKIDGVSATCCALARLIFNAEKSGGGISFV